jgi:signal transduction histidine kinase
MVYSEIKTSVFSLFLLWALLLANASIAKSIDLVPNSRSFETPEKITAQRALQHFDADAEIIRGNTTFGFSKNYFWILMDIPSDLNFAEQYFLDVDNPHINRIQVYHVSQGKINVVGQSGDRMPFKERTYRNRRNVFPVKFNTTDDKLLVFVDKRNASVFVPMVLWESKAFTQHEAGANMSYGFYFGMLLIIMLYSLLIYVTQRSPIYIWYLVYVASLFLYAFTYVGFAFQYLFPNQFEWNNYLRLNLIVVIVISQIRFTQLFLPIQRIAKWVNHGFKLVVVTLLLIILWWILVPGLFTTYTILVINSIYAIVGITLVLLAIALALSWKHDRSSVLFYTAAFGMNVLATVLMIAEEYGMVKLSLFPLPPLFIGSLFEIVIFAIGLSYRSKLIGDDRKKLLGDINHLQQQAMQSFVRGMEQEKVRVANELHDDVASRLSLLKLKLSELSEGELEAQISTISDGVRSISHQLNPVSLDEQTFLEKMRQLIAEHRQTGMAIDLQVFDLPKKVPQEIGLQLYRILQEALQNIQKYAKANTVDVQLFHHDKELVMTIEDDGIGFDVAQKSGGLGLKNMRLRTEQLNGEFSLSSAIGEGTSIMVSVPIG